MNIKYIPVPLSFCASGKANVNATDINGNNALHLCLMRRPAMMEFAKVSYNIITGFVIQNTCSGIYNACQNLFSK